MDGETFSPVLVRTKKKADQVLMMKCETTAFTAHEMDGRKSER